ncbi:ribonuclease H-like domain-containing protein [Piptocephalis cylindrospora]|uniref:3'-5' exonuclease n=1 Tax=Piptocephalis cylindrospora TaxID=1907219 RepID=A0A4P9Y1V5_9FUNG|nr:ribonuclease H-like domain-containing protein [Piptocephalis cylindrospora]|eukprot:RKP12051.1 ribonuclease H-like domain-containing protein [Piptocephalis cylindrospora]
MTVNAEVVRPGEAPYIPEGRVTRSRSRLALNSSSSSLSTRIEQRVPSKTTASKSTPRKATPPKPKDDYDQCIIEYTNDRDRANELILSLDTSHPVYGLDIEWRPTFGGPQGKAALMQLCIGKRILLLHLIHMESIPEALCHFLEDPTKLKTGLGIKADVRKLNRDYGLTTRGVLDLTPWVKALGVKGMKKFTLASLSSYFLGRELEKGPVRMGNWERTPLNPGQFDYAAIDAYVSHRLYYPLEEMWRKSENKMKLAPVVFDLIEVSQGVWDWAVGEGSEETILSLASPRPKDQEAICYVDAVIETCAKEEAEGSVSEKALQG